MSHDQRTRSTASDTTARKETSARQDLPEGLRGRTAPRQASADIELILSVPEGTIPQGWTGHWFKEDNVQQKLAEWWCNVTDKEGNNIKRHYKGTTLFLMALETDELKKIEVLREKAYFASIGEKERSGLADAGLSEYTPNGKNSEIEVQKDAFN